MDETNYTYISTHTHIRTHTERVKRDGGQDEVTSPCYVTSPIAPQPCNLQLPAYSNPMSGRSVQLSERVALGTNISAVSARLESKRHVQGLARALSRLSFTPTEEEEEEDSTGRGK